MLIKSHRLSRYRANSGKNKEKCLGGKGGGEVVQILYFVGQLLLKITSSLKNFSEYVF